MNKDTKIELIKEGIRAYQHEEQKDRKKTVCRNTELLMKHYNELKQHSENAIYEANQVFQNEFETDSNIYIDSILKSKVRTAIMVQHIDMALKILCDNVAQDCYVNKYNVFVDLYIKRLQYSELAEKYNCSEMTVRRWKNEMLSALSILLFGEKGLILET